MSLTRHLDDKNSPIRAFLRTQFPETRTLLKDVRSQVRKADLVRPERDVPFGTIGTALDYRLRYYFNITPNHELIAYEGARRLTDVEVVDPSEIQLGYKHNGNEIEFFDKATGKRVWTSLLDMNGGYGAPGIDLDHDMMDIIFSGEHKIKNGHGTGTPHDSQLAPVYQEFFKRLEDITSRYRPIGRRLTEVEEDDLNRHCIVLALLEEVFRARLREGSPLARGTFSSSESLMATAEPHWLDDLRTLSWKFYDGFNYLFEKPYLLNPKFDGSVDVGGADADMIVDGTLIDIKTSVKPEIQADWIWQLLGYVLLDYSDVYHINSLGLYMSRQGILYPWPLDEAIGVLCSGNSISVEELRGQFKAIARNDAVS